MTIGPAGTGLGNVSAQPYFLKTPDAFAVDQQRQWHDEAVYAYGEYSMFILFWTHDDFESNLCERCPYCWNTGDSVEEATAQAYQQATTATCDVCYGSTFYSPTAASMGGLKARIIRPCLWNASDVKRTHDQRGIVDASNSECQSISDFRAQSGDYIFRADGTRWRILQIQTDSLISGFQAQDDIRTMIGYSYPQCVQLPPSSVAFIIPPDQATAQSLLDISVVPNYPPDMSLWEVINGPLIGDDFAAGP